MSLDVCTKAIAANALHEASTLCYVTMNGNKQVLRVDHEKTVSLQDIENKLTNRYDKVTYYQN